MCLWKRQVVAGESHGLHRFVRPPNKNRDILCMCCETTRRVRLLCSRCADKGSDMRAMSEVELAVENSDVRRLRDLLGGGSLPNPDAPNPDGATLLVRASVRGSHACAGLLLEHRANPDIACGCYAETALQVCCARGEVGVAKVLIEAGSKINKADSLGRTPLFLSCLKDWPACTALMLDARAESERRSHTAHNPSASSQHSRPCWH